MAERALNPRQALLPIFDDAAGADTAAPRADSAAIDPVDSESSEGPPSPRESVTAASAPGHPASAGDRLSAGSEAAPDEAPALLDETVIGAVVLRELDRALEFFPEWAHPFAGLSFNRARRCYGQAHRDGRMVLSTVFIGTTALDDLEDTVRHEFAHLIAGIEARHGPRWRAVAERLGALPRATGRSRSRDLKARMDDAPFTLVAILESGEERELKPAFRRDRRFIAYRLGEGAQRYRCAGQDVLFFEYRRRRTATAGC